MPSFSRLVGAVLLAVLAWFVSQLIIPLFPPQENVGWFAEVNAAFGLLVGWRFLGARATGSIGAAIGNGLTASVLLLFTALFFQCVGEMIRLSFRRQYDTAAEAVVGVFELMVEYLAMLSTVEVWGALLIGGIVAGFVTEAVARRFD